VVRWFAERTTLTALGGYDCELLLDGIDVLDEELLSDVIYLER
jgi:hypothetical protein